MSDQVRRLLPLGQEVDLGARSRLGLTVSRLNRHAVVVTAAGEVDLSTADRLRQVLLESLDDLADGGVAVLDLAQVTFLDSSGLAALLTAHRCAEAREIRWRLCGLRPAVAVVLEITGVDGLLAVHPDLGSALTAGEI